MSAYSFEHLLPSTCNAVQFVPREQRVCASSQAKHNVSPLYSGPFVFADQMLLPVRSYLDQDLVIDVFLSIPKTSEDVPGSGSRRRSATRKSVHSGERHALRCRPTDELDPGHINSTVSQTWTILLHSPKCAENARCDAQGPTGALPVGPPHRTQCAWCRKRPSARVVAWRGDPHRQVWGHITRTAQAGYSQTQTVRRTHPAFPRHRSAITLTTARRSHLYCDGPDAYPH